MPANDSLILRITPLGHCYQIDIIYGNIVETYPLNVTREEVRDDNRIFRDELAMHVSRVSGGLVLPVSQEEEILRELARVGARAFNRIFPAGSQARDRIQDLLSRGTLKTIRIWAQEFAMPWELMCARPPEMQNGSWSRDKMWGECFTILKAFPLNRDVDSQNLVEAYVSRPKISLAADQSLRYVMVEINYLDRLHSGGEIYLRKLEELNPRLKESEMIKIVRFFRETSDVAHFACHVDINGHTGMSALVISRGFRLSPNDIEDYRICFSGAPLVVLNACDTGVRDPFQTANFIASILKIAEARGVIATECEVPTRFAAEFAQKFYDTFLLGQQSIGEALMATRKWFMGQPNCNPLGLLYSIYQVDPGFRFVRVKT
jgi:hypothetical protein